MYSECVTSPSADHVDQILEQWALARPDLDASPMGVIGRICRLSVLLVREQTRVFAENGLDFAGFDVLATLRRTGPPYALTPSQLARSMIVTPGAVAQRLTHLEEDGLITRTHVATDRRVTTVTLTPKGQDLIDSALPAHLANERLMLGGFDQGELAVFQSLLRRFLLSQGDTPV